MTTTININPTTLTDGLIYSNAVPLTIAEADLFGGTGSVSPDPISVVEGQTLVAVVKLSINGHIVGNNSWVFLQTDFGDGTWIDVAWVQYKATDAPSTFVLCGGGLGAMNNAFEQTRKVGFAPATQANGSNAVPLGGRCRFSGFSNAVGGSSSLAGVSTAVLASITYKLQAPR